MSKNSITSGARRAAVNDAPADQSEIHIDVQPESARARRGRGRRFGRGAVASVLAGTMAATALFGFAVMAREGDGAEMQADTLNADVAVPAEAVDAAQQGFADRSESVSRAAVRSDLASAVAEAGSDERTDNIDMAVGFAYESMNQETAEEREEALAADMELVEQQEEKLQEEARQAEEMMAAAQLATANGAPTTLSAEDIQALTANGGSMPLKSGFRIGAGFGATGSWSRYHTGQDFPAPTGTPIYAVASGVVLSPTAGGWAGTNVVIKHGNGGSTLYAHMSQRVVNPGQVVQAGQLIGYVGNTGRSFGSHLHLEYYKPGVTPGDVYSASNPMTFLQSLGVR